MEKKNQIELTSKYNEKVVIFKDTFFTSYYPMKTRKGYAIRIYNNENDLQPARYAEMNKTDLYNRLKDRFDFNLKDALKELV